MRKNKKIGITIRLQSIVTKLSKSKAYKKLEHFCEAEFFGRSMPPWVESCFFKLESKIESIMRRIKALVVRGNLSLRQPIVFYRLLRNFLPAFTKARRLIF